MLLKSFEIKEFDDFVKTQTFIIRNYLANVKDSFQYQVENKNHLTGDMANIYIEETKEALKALDNLSKYLRDGEKQ